MTALAVPTTAIADFDVLDDPTLLRKFVEALGAQWTEELAADRKVVSDALSADDVPVARVAEVRQEINEALAHVTEEFLPDGAAEKIKAAVRGRGGWKRAKKRGLLAIPAGNLRDAAVRLLGRLNQIGLYVVECGETESFAPSIGKKGSVWLGTVLEAGVEGAAFEPARSFVRRVISHPRSDTAGGSGTPPPQQSS